MRRPAALLLVALLLAAPLARGAAAQGTPGAAAASSPVTLIADRIFLRSRTVLVAEGNVEVLHDSARLRAARVVYDAAADRLTLEGPIVLSRGEEILVLADAAELSPDLAEGLMRGARLLLDRRLQLAASDLARTGGRYTRLARAVATSCRVCAGNPVPLWEIRAREVVHDEAERQIHFRGAQFRVAGLPVLWLPYLRMPDPTLRRATGFLLPVLRTTSTLGPGIKLPYFLTLGQSRDLTVTPYLAAGRTATLELRYRQAFRTGMLEVAGGLSRDDLQPGETRGYLFGTGSFALARGYGLDLALEAVSDPAYLTDYGLGARDRLTSGLTFGRIRREERVMLRALGFRSLRPDEDYDSQPAALLEGRWERRFAPAGIGGIADLTLQAFATARPGEEDGTGRDTGRLLARLEWQRSAVFGPGVVGRVQGALAAEAYGVRQDSAFPHSVGRLMPAAGVELRWPLVRQGARGGRTLLEPVAQLVWSRPDAPAVPNEDSRIVEFDEANLFALSRHAGSDGAERGLRVNLGVQLAHEDPAGWSGALTLGRVLRAEDLGDFTAASGLGGARSDWLVALRTGSEGGARLMGRALLTDGLGVRRGEVRLDFPTARADLGTALLWLEADPAEDRPSATAEWMVDADIRLNQNWSARLSSRYDVDAGRATEAGLGLRFRNECVVVDLSLSRKFTSSASVRPATDFSLTLGLVGFGGSGEAGPSRRCGP